MNTNLESARRALERDPTWKRVLADLLAQGDDNDLAPFANDPDFTRLLKM